MALTASATAVVERDIINTLGLSQKHLYRCVEPFNRSNLYYEVGDPFFTLFRITPSMLTVFVTGFNPEQVRYRPEPDPYRIKDLEVFIKATRKKAPLDSLNPAQKPVVAGIIYCRARKMVGDAVVRPEDVIRADQSIVQCDQVAVTLRNEGINARPFHKGLATSELDQTLRSWLDGQVECVVSIIPINYLCMSAC